jgi:thiol:disulfide interchange protein DsbA
MTKTIQTLMLAFAFASLPLAAPIQAQNFEEGTHYERIPGPDVADSDGVIEVVEIFSYTCPHCKSFQAYLGPWHEDLADDVDFQRISIGPEPLVRSFYTAEVLGIIDDSHDALFSALHDERQPFRSFEDLAEFHAQFDVSQGEFESTAESFPVESRIRRGNASAGKWRVRSTPTVVVNGKWRISPRRGGGFEELLQVTDYLIEREREAAAAASSAESS